MDISCSEKFAFTVQFLSQRSCVKFFMEQLHNLSTSNMQTVYLNCVALINFIMVKLCINNQYLNVMKCKVV